MNKFVVANLNVIGRYINIFRPLLNDQADYLKLRQPSKRFHAPRMV